MFKCVIFNIADKRIHHEYITFRMLTDTNLSSWSILNFKNSL